MINAKLIKKFQTTIYDFYQENKRDLPWRDTKDPYCILVSEVMLQQTQVSRVLTKYQEFLNVFPTIESLAKAKLSQLLNVWSGMGYNRRALYLQRTAQELVSFAEQKSFDIDSSDVLIHHYMKTKPLCTLPGIGKNTAGAIAAFAFNKPVVFIETNIRRVYIHFFFSPNNPSISLSSWLDQDLYSNDPAVVNDSNRKIHDNQLLPLIEQTLDTKNPREWYYALMDYGNYLAKITENPNRKSKHYTKQSKLEGSVREARGKILKVLLTHGKLSKQELEQKVNLENQKFEKALEELLEEKFIEKKKQLFIIKS